MSQSTSRKTLALFLITIFLAVTSFAGDAGGAKTPEGVWKRLSAALEAEDFAEMANCMSPEDRSMMTFGLYFAGAMMVGMSSMALSMGEDMGEAVEGDMSEEDKAEQAKQKKEAEAKIQKMTDKWAALEKKYGLDEDSIDMSGDEADQKKNIEKLFANIDQGALIQDLADFLKNDLGEDASEGFSKDMDVPQGDLENLKIDGDTAQGTVGDEDIFFIQVDGRWYLDAETMEENKKEEEQEAAR